MTKVSFFVTCVQKARLARVSVPLMQIFLKIFFDIAHTESAAREQLNLQRQHRTHGDRPRLLNASENGPEKSFSCIMQSHYVARTSILPQ